MSELPPLDPHLPQNLLLPPITSALHAAAGAGAFLIDPDKAEQFIAEVTACAHMLDDAKQAAREAGDIKSSGGDPVTENAVLQAKKMAANAEYAVSAYQRQLLDTAAGLQDQLAAYRATEQANTAGPG